MIVIGLINGLTLRLIGVSERIVVAATVAIVVTVIVVAKVQIIGFGLPIAFSFFMISKGIESMDDFAPASDSNLKFPQQVAREITINYRIPQICDVPMLSLRMRGSEKSHLILVRIIQHVRDTNRSYVYPRTHQRTFHKPHHNNRHRAPPHPVQAPSCPQ